MRTGKLENGFEYSIDEQTLDDMRFLDALEEADDGSPLAASKVCKMLLGKEQRDALYKTISPKGGRVPIADAFECIKEILEAMGDEGKNS